MNVGDKRKKILQWIVLEKLKKHISCRMGTFREGVIVFTFSVTSIKLNYGGIFQPAFTCSKLTMEALEQDVKYAQS